MPPSPLSSVLGTLRRLAGADSSNDLSDADLLERFCARREEAAFTLLVQRHGPMVHAVCCRVLGDPHEAEDAFQATFLVLVRRASSIRNQASLGSWLYGVAYRVAARARDRSAARRAHERKAVTAMRSPEPAEVLADPELRAALDEEMQRLPEKYRAPLVLCGLEGKTHEQAAQELHWSKSSVTARLARARDLLQQRLASRGFAVAAGGLAALLAEQSAPAAVPAVLTLATVQLALASLTGTAPATAPAVVLADHVLRRTIMMRLSSTLALLFTVGLAGAGLALLTPLQQPASSVPGGADGPKRGLAANRPGDALPEGVLARLGSGRLRHGVPVGNLDFSPDGKRLVSAGSGRIRVWDAATGRLEQRFRIDLDITGRPIAAFTSSGTLQVSSSKGPEDGCCLLDPDKGTELRRLALRASIEEPTRMALAPAGRLVAIAERDDVYLFDPTSGKETLHFKVTGLIGTRHLAISSDTRMIAVADNFSGIIHVHDTTTGKQIAKLKGEEDWKPSDLTFSPDGRSVAASVLNLGKDGGAIVWDVATGKERYRLLGQTNSQTCVFSPDSKRLAVGTGLKGMTLRDSADGKEVRRLVTGATVVAAAFTPDGKTLAASTNYGAIVLWDVDSGKLLPQSADSAESVSQLQFTEQGRQLIGTADDLIVWDPATGREVRRLPGTELPSGAAVAPSGKFLALERPNATKAFQLRDIVTGQTLRTLQGTEKLRPWVEFELNRITPNERRLVATSEEDMTILVWDEAGGAVVHRLKPLEEHRVTRLAVSPDCRWLASCSSRSSDDKDVTIRLWDLNTGQEAKGPPHQLTSIWDLAFSPDGSHLAAGGVEVSKSPSGRVQVWEVPAGKTLLTVNTQTKGVNRVAFSPDGRTLATGCWDGDLKLWEMATGGERQRFLGHEGTIDALAFAPDGQSLAAASADAPVFLWDVAGTSGLRSRLSAEELQRCWDDLAGDAVTAFRAIRRLAAVPDQALPFFRERLGPIPEVDPKRLRQLFDGLDSAEFVRRQKAAEDLRQLADRAADPLRREMRQTSSAEVRRALEEILESPAAIVPQEQRRAVRAVEAAEAMGTPEAARWLGELAGGAASARPTREAAAARDRLRLRLQR